MCQVSVKCPHCGTINKNLYLYETEGLFECECCGIRSRVSGYETPAAVVCTRCGHDKLDYSISKEGNWVATCRKCGFAQKLAYSRRWKTDGKLLIPVYDMDNLPEYFKKERRRAV